MRKVLLAQILMMAAFTSARAQNPFPEIDTNFTSKTVLVPASPFKYNVLFEGNTSYVHYNNGQDSAVSKQNHDFTGLIPLGTGNDSAWLIVNHEITNTRNDKLGDGGGMTAFKVVKQNGTWKAVPSIGGKIFHNVDFSPVRGTNINCGGAHTPWGTTLTAEEYPKESNDELWNGGKGFQDTSDYVIPAGNGAYSGKTIPYWQNFGWMVEADPKQAKAVKKYYGMGRFSHEGAYCTKDGKTVYLTDDFTPAVFFKFVANKANDYTAGQLYAYKQSADGNSGSWIALPMDFDSLVDARNVALRRGATMFTRLEWVDGASSGKIYLTETGLDNVDYNSGAVLGAETSYHGKMMDVANGGTQDLQWNDYYGRVLEFDPATNKMRIYLEGGNATNSRTNFSNPDGLTVGMVDGKEYLVLNEDLNGRSMNRVPDGNPNTICEIYFVELSKANATVDDLKRFLVGAPGAETTGGVFTPDGSTYFVNIQHPSSSNPAPFNNSATIAVTGFSTGSSSLDEEVPAGGGFSIYPNPASRQLFLNEKTDIAIYNVKGQRVSVQRQVKVVDISGLQPGIYFIQNRQGEVQKLIVE